jgi:alpha-amylase
MTNRINLLFGIHCHQPIGNFDDVFRKSFETCYKPFLDILERHPGVRTALHYSGCLLEWIEKNKPVYIDTIASLAERGQVEMLSGGFYEPILPAIPRDDAVGQIRMMNEYIQRRFGQQPRGLWLAERVWEPHLPSIIAEADLEYTIIDDTHFIYAGLGADELFGYYLTENAGRSLAVFPIDKHLRYTIPFKLPEDTISYLRSLLERDNPSGVTYGDDGEKFGVWPETYKWVYTEGYLEKLFAAFEENASWITMPTFAEFISSTPPMGRIYLPTASYDEMGEWALPADAATDFERLTEKLKKDGTYQEYRPFIRGGFWRNFLAKYPESNRLHKKMLHVSRKVNALPDEAAPDAKRELWRGQCNCPYWHGLFGGLYLNYLRFAVYNHLLRAEHLAEQAARGDDTTISVERLDYDCDGLEEYLVATPDYNFYISPGCGGAVAEIDYRPKNFNITDVMTRRPESYHRKLTHADRGSNDEAVKSIHEMTRVKEKGLDRILIYDAYERLCFLDHILPAATTLDEFIHAQYREAGEFVGCAYDVLATDESHDAFTLSLERRGQVNLPDRKVHLAIKKVMALSNRAGIEARYTCAAAGEPVESVLFAVELNLTLLAGESEERYYEIPGVQMEENHLNSAGVVDAVPLVRLVDKWMGIAIVIQYNPAPTVWRFPIQTVSQSEGGFEKTYQGSCVTALWPLALKQADVTDVSVSLQVEPL